MPRSVSTAFDRMLRERGDLHVLTEPFSRAYYDGPERRSDRYAEVEPDPRFSYDRVLADVLLPRDRRVAVKGMAHHLGPLLTSEVLDRFNVSFLTRDPARAVPSLARAWPDFTDEEAGFAAQRTAFDLVHSGSGAPPPVLDATEVRKDPDGAVRAWCAAVGLEFLPDAMEWDPGPVEGWERWREWFSRAEESRGFAPPGAEPPSVPSHLRSRVERFRSDYERLRAGRLTW